MCEIELMRLIFVRGASSLLGLKQRAGSESVRALAQVRMVSYLVDDPKYSFLKELGLKAENPGVFDGKWGGSGEVSFQFTVLYIILRKAYPIIECLRVGF